MSLLKTNAAQIGQSVTATNNFTMYQPASPDGTVRWGVGNSGSVTDILTLNSSGNVGIGTSGPSYKLDVTGTFSTTTSASHICNSSSPAVGNLASTDYTFGVGTHGTFGMIQSSTAGSYTGDFIWKTYNGSSFAERMRLDSSGNLGLGVTPSAWGSTYKVQQINATASFGGSSANHTVVGNNWYYSGTADTYIASDYATLYQQKSGQHRWYTAPSGTAGNAITFTQAMTLDASGNLGVGTTNPAGTKLNVAGGIAIQGNSIPTSGSGWELYTDGTSNSYMNSYNRTGAAWMNANFYALEHRYLISGVEKARLDSGGNFLVGTSSSNPIASRVTGIAINQSFMTVNGSSSGMAIGFKATSGTSINFYTDNGSAYVGAGAITSNGSTTAYGTGSDYRMKNNVQPMSGALDKVLQLNPVTYEWKPEFAGTKTHGQGFIAHELQEVVPDCVTGEKDAVDAEGNPVYQGIDTSFLVATLTKAIQELTARIEQLEAK